MGIADSTSANRNKRTICLPFSQDNYEANIHNPDDFRSCIDQRIELFPELFPDEIEAVPDYKMTRVRIIAFGRPQTIFINGDMGTGWALAF